MMNRRSGAPMTVLMAVALALAASFGVPAGEQPR